MAIEDDIALCEGLSAEQVMEGLHAGRLWRCGEIDTDQFLKKTDGMMWQLSQFIEKGEVCNHRRMFVRISKSMPLLSSFADEERMVALYFERSYDEPANRFIRQYYNKIYQLFERLDITFVYIPLMVEQLDDALRYNFPDSRVEPLGTRRAEEIYQTIGDHIVEMPPTERPLLLVTDYANMAQYPAEMLGDDLMSLCCIELSYYNDDTFYYALRNDSFYFDEERDLRFSLCDDDDTSPFDADWGKIDIISAEIRERIERLYAMGVNEKVIREIVALPEPKLSRMVITEDFRIVLPDYDNMEIAMPVLSKVLFFFYLRHPEGVLFKELSDYRGELSELYRSISPREDMEKMERSIDDICDSTKNSVNEKCSRIKAAFVGRFQEKLAKQYYITGGPGLPKRITLDRTLVNDLSGVMR